MGQVHVFRRVVYFLKHHVLLRSLRLLIISIPILVLLFLLTALYLGLIGFPGRVTEAWVKKLNDQGVNIQMDRIYLNLLEGFTAEGFAYFYDADQALALVEADRVELDLDVFQWVYGHLGLERLHVENAVFQIFPNMDAMFSTGVEPLIVDQASASLRFTEAGWLHMDRLKARCVNINLVGRGSIMLPTRGVGSGRITARGGSERVREALQVERLWFTDLVKELSALHFEESPTVDVWFRVDPLDLESSRVRMQGAGKVSRIRGIDLDGWTFQADSFGNLLRVKDMVGEVSGGSFRLSGEWNITNQIVEANLYSSLPPTHWLSLIPIEWRDQLRDEGIYLDGAMEVNATLGPAVYKEVWNHMGGTIHLKNAKAKGVALRDVSCAFDVREEEVVLDKIQAFLGSEKQGGFQGEFYLDRPSRRYHGHLTSQLDYAALLPILSSNMVKLVREASFPDVLPVADVDFAGQLGDKDRFRVDGSIAATNFVWRGTRVGTFASDLLVTNRTTTLRDLDATRSEGSAHGTLHLDFADRRVDIDMVSTMDPLAIGRAAGPGVENILKKFRFEGPSTSKVYGVVHVGTNGVTDLNVEAGGENIGFSWMLADQLDFDLHLVGQTVAVTHATGVIFGGDVEASFTCFPTVDDEGLSYALDMQVERADFSNLVATAKQVGGDPYRGRLSGQLALSGQMGSAAARTAVGSGRFKVTRGHLLQIPLFGGLSDALSALIPGLGFATETEVASDFAISNKVISFPNAKLEGSVLTLNADGDYHFDQNLDFDVGVRLLRDKTSVGKIVQIVTTPIAKLLEFHLGGTLSEPVWHPKLLSKDVSETGVSHDEP